MTQNDQRSMIQVRDSADPAQLYISFALCISLYSQWCDVFLSWTSPQNPATAARLYFFTVLAADSLSVCVCVPARVSALCSLVLVRVLCVAVGFFHRPTAFRAFPPVSNSSKIFQAPISSASGGDKCTKLCGTVDHPKWTFGALSTRKSEFWGREIGGFGSRYFCDSGCFSDVPLVLGNSLEWGCNGSTR